MALRALITGASSGIGEELAKIHAKKGGDLVLVARSKDKLEKLKSDLERDHRISVHVIVADLSQAENVKAVYQETERLKLDIDLLINNAGFGGYGLFHERDLDKDLSMIHVNNEALVALTHLYLPKMISRKKGRILNVASTAGFMPGPLQAVYFATKAFVVSLTQALSQELKGTGVTVTALCPGPVKTNFAKASDAEDVEIFDKGASAEAVAEKGYRAMEKGKLIIFDKLQYKILLQWTLPFLPTRFVLAAIERVMQKRTNR